MTSATRQYVTGFYFDPLRERVALIRKDHPPFQAGKLNGIGGKLEQGESPLSCMIREFEEEAGVRVVTWNRFAVLRGKEPDDVDFTVHFFYTEGPFVFLVSRTKEPLEFIPLSELADQQTIPNLQWLVPMALSMKSETSKEFIVTEVNE